MAKFVYNNATNTSIDYTSFKLNCSYHFCISFKEDTNSCLQLKIVDKLSIEVQKLMTVC